MRPKPLRASAVPKYIQKYWGAENSQLVVECITRAVLPNWTLLPPTRMGGRLIQPAIDLRPSSSDRHPLAFVSVSPAKKALEDLRTLRPFGRTLIVIPPDSAVSFFELSEADYLGVAVWTLDGRGVARCLVEGGSAPESFDPDPAWVTYRQTELLEFAERIVVSLDSSGSGCAPPSSEEPRRAECTSSGALDVRNRKLSA